MTDVMKILLPEGNEVRRSFERSFVESTVSHYQKLNVPMNDIINFFHKAQKSGADPLFDQIYLIPRKTKINGRETTVGTIVFSYHFIELQAQASGEYEGVKVVTGLKPYFNPVSGKEDPKLCSVCTIKRKGHEYEYTAWWPEYVQENAYGVSAQWKNKPYLMLEKCAKAGALRSAFPEWCKGMYAHEELGAYEKEQDLELERNTVEAEYVQKVDAVKARVEDMDDIKEAVEIIRGLMGDLTKDQSPAMKSESMKTFLGVDKFKDIERKTLPELKKIITNLQGALK